MKELEAIEIVAKRHRIDAITVMGHANIFIEEITSIADQYKNADEFCKVCGHELYLGDPPVHQVCLNSDCERCDFEALEEE